MSNHIPLENRQIVITGVSRREGLGFALCKMCAEEGAHVFLTARVGSVAQSFAEELGSQVRGLALDITAPDSIAGLQTELEKTGEPLDVLINNAAGTNAFGETASEADLDAARDAMSVTLFGTWALTQALLPLLRASDHGRIVNVSSGAGSHGDAVFGLGTDNPMGVGYGASKAALNALTHRMALEEAKRDGSTLRINAVCPGFTATFEGGDAMGARPPEESAKGVLWAAKLPDDGPTGGFFRDGEVLPW